MTTVPTVELFAFRYRDALTGKIAKSCYKAKRSVIEQRHPGAEIIEGSREVCADD